MYPSFSLGVDEIDVACLAAAAHAYGLRSGARLDRSVYHDDNDDHRAALWNM
jgi:hypothetical protein